MVSGRMERINPYDVLINAGCCDTLLERGGIYLPAARWEYNHGRRGADEVPEM